jgi:altronate hydrolase
VNWLQLHRNDSVAVALRDQPADTTLPDGCTVSVEPIPAGHKVAVCSLAQGTRVIRYNQLIGITRCSIRAGEHVHSHNLVMPDNNSAAPPITSVDKPALNTAEHTHFLGYQRSWCERPGTRNYIAIVPTVNCAGTIARRIAEQLNSEIATAYPALDGAIALHHALGCATDAEGEGLALLRRTQQGWLRNPNIVGALVLSLGCETNHPDALLAGLSAPEAERVQVLDIQRSGGTEASIQQALDLLRPQLKRWNEYQREPVPLSGLCLALQCGGSDSFSGLSANPALGVASDLLGAAGGSVILAETPEIYGAEQLLTQRAVSDEVANALNAKVHWWQDYAARQQSALNHNPSPGNKAGGLTTILEKSLGAIAKGGNGPLQAVIDYAAAARAPGLNFMDSPGYDPVSITGQVASGANVICFTTGRGSVYGCKPVPVLKLASNSALYQRMTSDMDIDCGAVLNGDKDLTSMGSDILTRIVEIASGQRSASERLGLGDDAFVPWAQGVLL